jgi:hypothetical protein
MALWHNFESDRVGADARATRRGRLWAVRPTARARPKGAAIHQKGTLTSAFLFELPSSRPIKGASAAPSRLICARQEGWWPCRPSTMRYRPPTTSA